MFYHAGNRDLPTATVSLLFYANPITQLWLSVIVFGGVFTFVDGLTFGLIWAGIIIYFASR